MNDELSHLTNLIEDFINQNDTQAANPNTADALINQVAKESLHIKETFHSVYRSQPDSDVLRRYFKDYLASLTILADQLTGNIRSKGLLQFGATGKFHPGDDGKSYLLYCLSHLIDYMETRFGDITDKTLPVPLLYQIELQNAIAQQYSRIKKGLEHKKADATITDIILRSLNAIIHPRKPLRLTWDEHNCLHLFISNLTDFATDKRRKDYGRRLLYILFRNNFNHPGLYRHLKDTFEKELKQKKRTERIRMLREGLLDAEQIDVLPGLIFQHEHRSLKGFCIQWLQKRLENEENDQKEEELAKEYLLKNSFRLSFSVSLLAVLLQWFHRKERLPYPTFKELAKAFSRTHSDGQGNRFKESTLAKKPDGNTLLRFYQEMKKFLDDFKEYYKL